MNARAPYGLFAAFKGPEALLGAAGQLRDSGYRALDAHTSYPVEGLEQALDLPRSRVGWIILAGAIFGAVFTYGLVLYSVTLSYPINVGGRPLNAWPPYLLLAFEGGVLGGTLAALLGFLGLCRLPAYHHPAFDFAAVDFADQECFVLVIHASDPEYDAALLRRLLDSAGATRIDEIMEAGG